MVVRRIRGLPPVPILLIQPGGYPQGSLEKERNPYLSAPDMDDEKERSSREEHVYMVVRRTRGPPPVPTPPIQPEGYPQGSLEKERNPYPSAPDIDDKESSKLFSIPLERERKPYTAREDTGKLYGTKFLTDPPGALRLSTADLIPRLSAGAIAA
ncbi:hypothetical protein K469DRAFT_707463 [Zopfia rhizophila CBS 207.26]|uniref:Uncharacterized protein n=1 Tax=Zopfia rhizophila CBS 207.26 TaxID=1314779 RepID=A0A6A6E6I3_9PEZI|nr:hypothetical protein K469DRAFT_707463 [Zopfia rhizophila CBS 207.26]